MFLYDSIVRSIPYKKSKVIERPTMYDIIGRNVTSPLKLTESASSLLFTSQLEVLVVDLVNCEFVGVGFILPVVQHFFESEEFSLVLKLNFFKYFFLEWKMKRLL